MNIMKALGVTTLSCAFLCAAPLPIIPAPVDTSAPDVAGVEQAQSAGAPFVSAQTGEQHNSAVDDYVESQRRAQHIPGLALGVMRDSQIIMAQGYGFANIELGVAVSPKTIFQSGSVGKQFTATAIMMLVEQGKLALDDPLGKYLPGTPANWKTVTIRNLLTHTSGIADYTDAQYAKPGGLINLRGDYTEDELFARLAGHTPAQFSAGRKMELQQYRLRSARLRNSQS